MNKRTKIGTKKKLKFVVEKYEFGIIYVYRVMLLTLKK